MKQFARVFFFALLALTIGVPATAADTPTGVVTAFYARYIHGSDKTESWMKSFLAPDTYALYERAQARNRSGDLVLDYDPFTGVQVESFDAKVRSKKTGTTETDVTVSISSGLSKTRSEWHDMHVIVRLIDNRWQLWNFIAYEHGKPFADFRKLTTANLARKGR